MTSLGPRFDEYKEIRMVFPGMDLFFHSGDSSFIGSGVLMRLNALVAATVNR